MTDSRPFGPDRSTARVLLDIGAVAIRPEEPFHFTSGWASPVYIDCRRLISFPAERQLVLDSAMRLIGRHDLDGRLDAIAGGETAGIPYAAWLADRMSKPMLYVRKKPKGFGRNARIEGHFAPGSRVLLIEDLATDGQSKLEFAAALRDAEAIVDDAIVIFFYGIFPGALESLAAAGLKLHYLATWWDVIAEAEEHQRYPQASLDEAWRFLEDPVAWSAAHGGRDAR
jgi:orotate phosphoribosyltransferase